MNELQIKGDWKIIKGKMKQKWGSLTNDDLAFVEGKLEETVGKIQKRTGETQDAITRAIEQADNLKL